MADEALIEVHVGRDEIDGREPRPTDYGRGRETGARTRFRTGESPASETGGRSRLRTALIAAAGLGLLGAAGYAVAKLRGRSKEDSTETEPTEPEPDPRSISLTRSAGFASLVGFSFLLAATAIARRLRRPEHGPKSERGSVPE
jgi:hypothetical protein